MSTLDGSNCHTSDQGYQRSSFDRRIKSDDSDRIHLASHLAQKLWGQEISMEIF
ncbi:MAG: hypothetical protein KJ990_14425 [Proteobacteria bacterium]|nr:hypothetical protein [Pseudomonadota bacterium]MBU1650542.1 hypothetical protein [Pseudomonadota bacterium]